MKAVFMKKICNSFYLVKNNHIVQKVYILNTFGILTQAHQQGFVKN